MKNLLHKSFNILICSGMLIFLCSCDTTSGTIPILTTTKPSDITPTTAISGGNISDDGGTSIATRGVCWSKEENPVIDDNITTDGIGTGTFISNLYGMTPNTKYYIRAYATNSAGTSYGNEETITTPEGNVLSGGQIIANHSIIDKYDDIPSYYLNEVKKMWFVLAGESHSEAYRTGLQLLESSYPNFSVNITESGIPEPYTNHYLRASSGTWGDRDHETGWIYSYGEEDWYTSDVAITRTKSGISYCNSHNLTISAIGFGWCYDPDITVGEDISAYLNATQQYIDQCNANYYPTKVFFTTGPLDEWFTGAFGYNNYLRYEQIRDYVAQDSTRILFDYADILSWDDDGTQTTQTWDIYTYPAITARNYIPVTTGHISNAGALRLAKAIWWMLARIAGWDGN